MAAKFYKEQRDKQILSIDFLPCPNTVIVGRGKKVAQHAGNVRFQELVKKELTEYSAVATTKADKSNIIQRVLTEVRLKSPHAFVKQDLTTLRWYRVEENAQRITTAQAFRDALKDKYKSSRVFKKLRREKEKKAVAVAMNSMPLARQVAALQNDRQPTLEDDTASNQTPRGLESKIHPTLEDNTASNQTPSGLESKIQMLSIDFLPCPNTVIVGRGKKVAQHPGNVRFQELIKKELTEYSAATTKADKSSIIQRVLTEVRLKSPHAFVKQDLTTLRWYCVEESVQRITIAQAFRDVLKDKYKSSRVFKKLRREEEKKAVAAAMSCSMEASKLK
ncbi:Nitrilase family, member 2 [Seminavis robusta]|uniref:Nitrilase family, member 2 n=1 Tax=Seminavis robusta TaxID=568900 RepID=A0A9N8DDQ0_9STRA|nr:Nitrilase family, member 2 [Seminavis robusta]|eukprot:Sro42_g025480.1 Nitrilase family, member 2 (334) ;mRNA; r:34388-35389